MVKKTKSENKKVKKNTTSSAKIKKLNAEIKELKNLITNSSEKNLRLMAEFENFKKRNNKILNDSYQISVEKIVGSFLPIFILLIISFYIIKRFYGSTILLKLFLKWYHENIFYLFWTEIW